MVQKKIVDFGSDKSFEKASKKMIEHYGFSVPPSTIRSLTEMHGEQMLNYEINNKIKGKQAIKQIIVETDGTMIPKVEFDEQYEGDLRKTRKCLWKEVRLTLGYLPGEVDPLYAATAGKPEDVGKQLKDIASRLGYDTTTDIHGVGDGASWIAIQMEEIFGAQGTYTIDFYHLCEYLCAASKTLSNDADSWYKEQKTRMKQGKKHQVLEALMPHLESPDIADEKAPIRACFRYMTNRPKQFDYVSAIEKGLPIGSGKVESGHRTVLQHRLKIPGAWWKTENIEKMSALLVIRENEDWDCYWQSQRSAA
jgi:hypothetical protein